MTEELSGKQQEGQQEGKGGNGGGWFTSRRQESVGALVTRIILALIVLFIMLMVWVLSDYTQVTSKDYARGLITVIFGIGTVAVAMTLVLSSLLLPATDLNFKERFGMAKEVLTLMLGIFGAVIGFYFGTGNDVPNTPPPTISEVIVPAETPTQGDNTSIMVLIDGGEPDFRVSVDFGASDLKPVEYNSSQRWIKVPISLSGAEQTGLVEFKVVVSDSLGRKSAYPNPGWLQFEILPDPSPEGAP